MFSGSCPAIRVWEKQALTWTSQVTLTTHVQLQSKEIQDRRSHRRAARPGWFWGSRCCHLLWHSLFAPASCLSGHCENQPVHMSVLCACMCPQKRVNASVRPLSRATTLSQAGILMSVFFPLITAEECRSRDRTPKLLDRESKREQV